ncbi:MAG: anti-sigma factor antagonist [Clostridia bacterium]|nr:anti-sigma factor antagonist [Clostridia bacterium]
MNINYSEKEKILNIEITEEIDHHGVEMIRKVVDDEITKVMPRKIIFDFGKVTFMDSAAIGMLIGRYKMAKMLGGSVEIINLKQGMKKILEMSGVLKIIPAKLLESV